MAVGTRLEVLWRDAFGRLDYEGGPPARTDTLYDLASLTKVIATTSVILTLIRDGQLSLDDPVTRVLPELTGEGTGSITVEHLLTHSSGLPAWKPFHSDTTGYENVLRRVVETTLEAAPGTRYRYSDLGFMMLGEVAARAGKQPLAELERERVFSRLGMRRTLRNPEASLRPRIAPTEKAPVDEAGVASGAAAGFLHGVVHDENSRAAGGITGHAGLFSTADDLALFATEILRGLAGESPIFPADLLGVFTARSHVLADSSRALGWDMKTRGGSAGRLMSDESFGHTGYTGTSMWIDPRRGLYVILLTNRVHPTRDNNRIQAVRRDLADAVTAAFDRWKSARSTAAGQDREDAAGRRRSGS